MSRILALFWCYVLRTRRREMIARVARHLEVDSNRAKRIVHGVYENLTLSLVHVLFGYGGDHIASKISVLGLEHLKRLQARSAGFVVVTAHTGNWELLTHLDQICGIRGGFVSKGFRLRTFNTLLRWTRRYSLEQFPVAGHAKVLITRLRRGESVGFAVDQHTNNPSALQLNFLGEEAWCTTAPARLARLARVPILPIRVLRQKQGDVIEIMAPLEYEWSSDRARDIRSMTSWYNQIVEDWIRERPEEWLWLHRRWKPNTQQGDGII